MKLDKSYLINITKEINNQYVELHKLDNDELRALSSQIERTVNLQRDKSKALDELLVPTFAIVKETARRFTLGEVAVKANDFDRKLAKHFDFVIIEADRAIYKNRWTAGGDNVVWKMIHYDEQLYAGILLHKGYAVEMATGEGKTLTATLPTFLNALTHDGVHILTVNDYLSKRDCELTRPLYFFHGLSVDCVEYSQSRSSFRRDAYLADITFGTNSTLAFDYLLDHCSMRSDMCMQRKHNYVLIDELDSILIDSADDPHIISVGSNDVDDELYKKYNLIIKNMLSCGIDKLYESNYLIKESSFTELGKQWLRDKCEINDLFRNECERTLEFRKLLEKQSNSEDVHFIENVLMQAFHAHILYYEGIDYIVKEKRIIIVDSNTGRLKEGSKWEHGLHQAVEAKEDVPISKESISSATISLKNYFKLYKKISGMSGTLLSVADELGDAYGLNIEKIKTHRPNVRNDERVRLYLTRSEKDVAIINLINDLHYTKRPILIGCHTIKRAEELSHLLGINSLEHNLITARDLEREAYIVSKAGCDSMITVATNIAGRGTDIKLDDSSRKNGGLVVIIPEMFDSKRIDDQLRGRAGRQGDPGSSYTFISMEDDIIQTLTNDECNDLELFIKDGTRLNHNSDLGYNLVALAQARRDLFHYDNRNKVVLKDDTVAPYRTQYYQRRNTVLHKTSNFDLSIFGISMTDEQRVLLSNKINILHNKARLLVERSYSNNRSSKNVYLPLSYNKETCVICLDCKKIIENQEYFEIEFKKQIILEAYDRLWNIFVNHLLSDLDSKEIDLLPNIYEQMIQMASKNVIRVLLGATIPIVIKPISSTFDKPSSVSDVEVLPIIEKTIDKNIDCPCGSGKIFSECHGSDIRSKSQKKRR